MLSIGMYFNIGDSKKKGCRSSATLFVCISFISIVSVSTSPPADDIILQRSDCFSNYLQQVVRININYEHAVLSCNDKDNINRLPPQHLDAEAEIEKHKQTSRETCLSLTVCNFIPDSLGFFLCHSKYAEENLSKLVIMQLNASSVAIELSDQYEREEKEILRCHLAAKRKYFSNSSHAYKEHLDCLNSIKRNSFKSCNHLAEKY